MENEGKIEVEKEKVNPCASITSMKQWVEDGDESECRPCLLPPVLRWYRDHLQQNGLNELAHEMEILATEGADPLVIAETFDSIKAKVPDDVKERLKEFDCAAQLYKEIEETKTNGR